MVVVAFLGGMATGSAFQKDYINEIEQENKRLLGVLKPLVATCEPGEVYVATKADNGPWSVRCVSGPRRKK
jgi:hypothetical protein